MASVDTEFLQREWAVIADAPFITLAGIIFVGGCVWALVNWFRSQEVAGAKSQVESWKARWELVRDKLEDLEAKNTQLLKTVEKLDTQIRAHASTETLAATSASLGGLVTGLATTNSDLRQISEGAKKPLWELIEAFPLSATSPSGQTLRPPKPRARSLYLKPPKGDR